MRVLVVCPWEPWRTGDGVVLPMWHHLQQLHARHDLTVLAGSGTGAEEEVVVGPGRGLPDGLVVRSWGTDRSPALDLLSRRAAATLRREPAHALFVERPGLLAAFDALAPDVDVVHLVGWGTAQLAARTGTPAVHVAVDPWAASWHNRRLPGWRRVLDVGQRRLAARHEQRHYPRAASVVVVAEADARLLERTVPGAKYDVVGNGVEPGPAPVPPPAQPVLSVHGSWETQANVDAAVALVEQVWPRVRARVPEATVRLFGRSVDARVSGLVQPGVELLGEVPSVRAELDRTTVHVSWMTSGLGMKNKVLEAMAAGRPVVANARGASGIGAGDGVVVAGDLDGAADAVVALLTDAVRWEQQSAAARQRVVEGFSWAASARAVEQLWERAAR